MLSENNGLKYFRHTKLYYGFLLLKKIYEYGIIELPFETSDTELAEVLSHVSFQDLINENLVEKAESDQRTALRLTKQGLVDFHKHHIDYQLDLLKLENVQGSFFHDLIDKLKKSGLQKAALYGASDTTKSILKYLHNNNVEVVCVLDDDVAKQGLEISGIKIISLTELEEYSIDALIISTIQYQDELYQKAQSVFRDRVKVISLFDMDQ